MIVAVTWQYTILELGSATTGYRVARRMASGYTPPVFQSGADTPLSTPSQFTSGGNAWHRTAPGTIHYPPAMPYPNGFDYDFAFCSLSGSDAMSTSSYAQILESPNLNVTFGGTGAWVLTANAYYFRNFDEGGPGDEALYIDMFDITANAFIAPDFVDVTPDPTGTLTADANNGYIDTSAQISAGASNRITVAARDSVGTFQFDHWLSVPTLQHAHDPSLPPQIGQPDPHDLVIGQSDDVTAFAFYNEVPRSLPHIREPWLYNPWWWIETHGGLVPPGRNPWERDIAAARALTTAAQMVSPALRNSVLKLAIEQLAHASTAIGKGMAAPKASGGVAKASKAKRSGGKRR